MKNVPRLEYLDYQSSFILMSWANRFFELLSGLSSEPPHGYSEQCSAVALAQVTDKLVLLGLSFCSSLWQVLLCVFICAPVQEPPGHMYRFSLLDTVQFLRELCDRCLFPVTLNYLKYFQNFASLKEPESLQEDNLRSTLFSLSLFDCWFGGECQIIWVVK